MKLFRGIQNSVKIGQKYRELHAWLLLVACAIKHCCVTLSIFILLTVTRISKRTRQNFMWNAHSLSFVCVLWSCNGAGGSRRPRTQGHTKWDLWGTEWDRYKWRTEAGGGVPPTKFRRRSKIVPNSTRLWKRLKIAQFRMPTPHDVRKKGSKFLKLPRFAIVLH